MKVGRYIMTVKTYNRFISSGYDLSCKICECPCLSGDEIESKSSGKGPKLYHAECYDRYHLAFDDEGNIYNGLGDKVETEENETD